MADYEVVETIYGKYSKYEIRKKSGGVFGDSKFYLYKDGKSHRGPYSSLRDAVDKAREEV